LKNASNDAIFEYMRRNVMRTTVTLDDDLLKDAAELTGIKERSQLIHAALTALIQREAARRLALLGGTDPNAKLPRRRRAA
jgi:Arc/MetJ family transcription regulator